MLQRALNQFRFCQHISRSCIIGSSSRFMASSSGSDKFGLPKRYQEATESVWYVKYN